MIMAEEEEKGRRRRREVCETGICEQCSFFDGQTGLVAEQRMELFSFYACFHCHSKGSLNKPVKKEEAHGEFYKNHPKIFYHKEA